MLWKITYFKQSGKYYGCSALEGPDLVYDMASEIRILRDAGELPGLAPNCGKEFDIHISDEKGFPHIIPALVDLNNDKFWEYKISQAALISHKYGYSDYTENFWRTQPAGVISLLLDVANKKDW